MSFNIDLNTRYQYNCVSKLNPYTVANDFCDLYYRTMVLQGFTGVSYMFDANVLCNYNGVEYIGLYNVAIAIASEGIMKLTYDNLIYSCSVIDNNTMLIQVSGLCQGITFWSFTTSIYSFTETFVLKYDNGSILVNNYLFKI